MQKTKFLLKTSISQVIFTGGWAGSFSTVQIPEGVILTVTTNQTPEGLRKEDTYFYYSNGFETEGTFETLGRYIACGAIVQQT